MTGFEKIQYAKQYIDKMANGINPLDNTLIPEDDVLNNISVSRCLFFVSDILRQVLENDQISVRKKKVNIPFSITREQIEGYIFEDHSISMSEIARKLNALVDNSEMYRMSYRHITAWLLKIGALCEKENNYGKIKKYPTEFGNEMGIYCEARYGRNGAYEVILFNCDAQKFILDNIDAVIAEM